ncbi:MAG: radical SAM family heme chaperone HemW [Motiliproteus sp.]
MAVLPHSDSQKIVTLPPLSLYVHVPWCVRKCPYCDFNSHDQDGELPEQDYLSAVLADLTSELQWVQGRLISSIFIGGGTPSLMSGDFYQRLLADVEQRIGFEANIEITLEANPGTFEQARFEDYRRAGINRLSLGIQSFSDQSLKALGRIHCADESIKAVQAASQLGFERINLDLMHGLPGQSLAAAMADLQQAMDLGPSHISWYQLTIEPNTEFYSRPPVLPEDEALWQIQEQGQALLACAGYQQYEISAYCQPGQQSRHNLNYWQFGDYIGIGAGAHGKITDLQDQRLLRRWKKRQPKDYMQAGIEAGVYLSGEERIEAEALPLEFMMNAMRLYKGVDASLFSARTGLSMAELEPQLAKARSLGLMEPVQESLVPSERGRRFLNDLLQQFM